MSYIDIGTVNTAYRDSRNHRYDISWRVKVLDTGDLKIESQGLDYITAEDAVTLAGLIIEAAGKSPGIVAAFRDNQRLDDEVAKAKADRLAAFQRGDR